MIVIASAGKVCDSRDCVVRYDYRLRTILGITVVGLAGQDQL